VCDFLFGVPGECVTIFGLPDRSHYMRKFSQIGSSFLIAIFLVFSANASSWIVLPEEYSGSSSENHRDCAKDDLSARTPNFAHSRFTNQRESGRRYPDKLFNATIANSIPLNSLGRRNALPAEAHPQFQKTVLRI
jgi:hypothetical protein